MLSGFLITTILLHEQKKRGRVNFSFFVKRRLMRLAPAAMAMCTTFVIAAYFFLPDVNAFSQAIVAMTYMADYGVAIFGVPKHIGHMWSLSVEMHFYIFWPLVIIFFKKIRWPLVSICFGCLYIAATIWRFMALINFDWSRVYYSFDTRLSGFLLGGWLASVLLYSNGEQIKSKMLSFVWISFPLIFFVIYISEWNEVGSLSFGVIAIEWCTAFILVACTQSHHFFRKFLSIPVFVWFGKISYGLYLWHYPIFWYLRHNEKNWILTLSVGMPISIVLAVLSLKLIENKWKIN